MPFLPQDSLYRQEHQRSLAARVAAAVTYQLLRLSDEAGEVGAAAHFGRLQLELLKAYDPRFALAGRPALLPGAELQEEASQLHDVLLQVCVLACVCAWSKGEELCGVHRTW